MTSKQGGAQRLAILIDAENASPRIAKRLFEEVAHIGETAVRRVYGDFSSGRLRGWCEAATQYAILPQQVLTSSAGKNASDIALVIDAMDLLHTGRFDAFCLVSSDGDFTRLAARLREHGVDVYGFGECKTPDSFRQACKSFVFTEAFLPVASTDTRHAQISTTASPQLPHAAVVHLEAALHDLEHVGGWYPLGSVGTLLSKREPRFELKAYGCTKLLTLVERSGAFDVRRENLAVSIRSRSRADVSGAPVTAGSSTIAP